LGDIEYFKEIGIKGNIKDLQYYGGFRGIREIKKDFGD